MNNREPDSEIEYQPKPWLSRLLLTAQTPETSNDALEDGRVTDLFLTRCEEAAYVGLSVLRLRRERHRVGFVPMSFDQYIDGLVKVADVSISPVLNWLGIKNLSSPVVSTAAVRLAREIDISRRE